jgi:hypothetical protein
MRWLVAAAVVSALSSAVLVLTLALSASKMLDDDAAWTYAGAMPSALAALLIGVAVLRSWPKLACFGGGLLILPCVLGGAWAMVTCPLNDAKWTCVWAGIASAAAGIVASVVGGVRAFSRPKA